jgi:hypothetical protein
MKYIFLELGVVVEVDKKIIFFNKQKLSSLYFMGVVYFKLFLAQEMRSGAELTCSCSCSLLSL